MISFVLKSIASALNTVIDLLQLSGVWYIVG